MRVDFLGLQAFVGIAEQGSFRQAAAHLNISQTALSHRMRKLEDYFGVKLMMRTTRQVTLTPAGFELLPKAQRALSDLETSLESLREYGKGGQEQLAIGCLPTIASNYLPRLLKLFSAEHPDIAIRIFDNSASEIAEKVANGTAEFGITILSINSIDLVVQPLLREPFMLVAPTDHPLAARPFVDCADLVGTPLVRISAQAGNRLLIDDALRNRNELTWRYEVQHVSTALNMVRAGNGLTIIPGLAVEAGGYRGLTATPLRNPSISRMVGIIRRRGGQLSPAAEALIDLTKREMRSLKASARNAERNA